MCLTNIFRKRASASVDALRVASQCVYLFIDEGKGPRVHHMTLNLILPSVTKIWITYFLCSNCSIILVMIIFHIRPSLFWLFFIVRLFLYYQVAHKTCFGNPNFILFLTDDFLPIFSRRVPHIILFVHNFWPKPRSSSHHTSSS